MTTEDAKPESTLAMDIHIFQQDKEKENKEFFTEDSGMQVDKLLLREKKQESSLDKCQGSIESNFRIEYPTNDITGSYVSKSAEEESRDLQKYNDEGSVGEDDVDVDVEHKFPTTTAFFKEDPQHTSFPTKKEYSELLSPPADTKMGPEMRHSSVTVLDEIKETETNSDFAEKVSMEGETISSCSAFPNEYNEMEERENGHSNMGQLSSPLVELKSDIISATSEIIGKREENSGTEKEDSQDSPKSSQETKETPNEFEILGMDNIESSHNDRQSSSACENSTSLREFSDTGCLKIKESHTEIENQNKSLEEVVEANNCKTALDIVEESAELRSTVEPDDKHTEKHLLKAALEKNNHTDSLHDGVPPEIAASGKDYPTVLSIQERTPTKSDQEVLHEEDCGSSYDCDTKVEDSTQEYTATHIEEVLDDQRTGDQEDIMAKMKEEEIPERDSKGNTLEMCRDYGVAHDQNNRGEYINQAIKDANLSPEEVNQDINPSNLAVEECIGNTENAGQNRKPESAKGDGSLQEFQNLAQAIEPVDEASNLELLDVKDLSLATSNEISKAGIPPSAKDVIWEQKEYPITKESEEVKEANEEVAYATNLVSQSPEENSSDHKAIDTADDSTDNTNVPRRQLEREETSIGKAHVHDNSLGTLDIYLHESPEETISGTKIGLSTEEIDYAKLENIPGLPLQHQTTKPEYADKKSIADLAENEAAGKCTNNSANESQDHSANMLVAVEEIQTVEYNEEYKTAEDNSKEITNADPECRSVEAVFETKAEQTSSAVEEVDFLEEISLRKLPNEVESLNIIESKNGSSKNSENIVNETSNASFATTLKKVVPQKEENKSAGSDVRGDPTQEIENHNGTLISESDPKESLSVKDDPSTVECEKSNEAAVEEKTGAGETINSESTNTDVQYLALSQSLGKDNQTIMKDEKYKEATEQLPRTDQIHESDLEILSSQEFSRDTEMKKEKHTTEEKDAVIEIRNLNQIQEASTREFLVEKIGDKSSAEDSRCGSPEDEVNQETSQEGELKPELDPRETVARISEDTKHLEETETMDANLRFKKQISEQQIVEGSSLVSMEEELANYDHVEEGKDDSLHEEITPDIKMPNEDITAEENKEERNLNGTKQEEDSEVKDELKSSADGSEKFEEPETSHSTQGFLKQLQNEERTVERPVSIAEQTVHSSPAEEEEERNVNETKNKDELKPQVVPISAAEDMSETTKNPSNNSKLEETQTIEPTQSFNKEILSDNEIVEGPTQVAQAIISDSFAEEEEMNHTSKTAPDDLMPEKHHGVKFEEPKMIETTERFYREMQGVVERPPEFSIAEHAVNYKATGGGIKEQIITDTATFQYELYPDVDLETKADEIPETTRNASESTEFRQPETIQATQSFNTQMISEDKVTEQPHQVTTAERNEKNVKDAPLDELKLEEFPRVEGPDTAIMTSFSKQMSMEDKVVDRPPQDSIAEEVINYSTREDVGATIISNKQQSQVDPGEEVSEISLTINDASDSTKVDITWHSNEAMINEDMVIEGPSQVSTEGIPNRVPEEKTKGNVMDATIRDELKTEVYKRMVHEIPETTKIASETTKSKEPETIEATQRSNMETEIQENDVETPLLVSFAEKAVKCNPAEERKEDNVNYTGGYELKPAVDPEVKVDETFETTNNLEGTDMIDAAQSFMKQTPCKDQVDEEPCPVLTTEITINDASAGEGKEEWYVSNSTKEVDLKSKVYTEVMKDEVSETNNSRSHSTKMTDAKQSCEMWMKSEDKVIIVEEPRQASTSEEKVNYSLLKEEGRNANNTKAIDELNQEVDPEVGANDISGTTYYASKSTKFQQAETIAATQSQKKQMQGEDKVVEGPTQISNTEELVEYNHAIERKEERNVNDTKNRDELKPGLEESEITEVTGFNKQMASEEKIVEGPPKDSISKKTLNYSPSGKGKDESNLEDTTSKDELKIDGNPNVEVDEISETTSKASETTKLEEHELIDVAQSFEKQMLHEDKAIERPNESPIAEGIVNYSPEEEVMEERTIKYANKKDASKSDEDTEVNSDEIISETTVNATESTQVKDYSEDKKFPNQDQYHSSLTVAEDPKREVQSKPHLNKRPTDGMLPKSEGSEARKQVDNSNKEIAPKGDMLDDLIQANNETRANHMPFQSSIAASNLEITAKDPKTGTDAKIASADEEMSTMQKGPPGETLQQEIKELKPEDAFKAVAAAVSDLQQENRFKDDKMEERVTEQVKLSKHTSIPKLHVDENEHKKIPDQNERHSSFTIDESAKDVQSELNFNKRTTEGMLPESEVTEATNQVDNSNKVIDEKDDLIDDLTEANNDFEAIQMPSEGCVAVSDLEILSEGDPKIGTDSNIASQDEEMPILQKGPPGETSQPETEELKPQDAFKVVSRAVSDIPQESSCKDDKMEEKVEEQVKLSKQTSVTKLHEDENEHKKIQDQNEYHSSFTMDDSAKESQSEPNLNKRHTEGMLPESEAREAINQVDHSNKVIVQKDDLTKANNKFETIQTPFESPIAVPGFEILAKEDPKTGKIASQDEAMSILQKGTPGETPEPETEEWKPQDASKVVSRAVSGIPLESSFKDNEMEENVEEQVKLSKQTSVTKLHEDENEQKKIQDQNEYHSSFTMDNSAKEDRSEPNLNKRPTEGMLPEIEVREAINQVDHSNKMIAQKDDPVDDLTEADNNFEAIQTPFESSIAVSDLEILAEENPKTGTDPNIASQDEEISILQKRPPGETSQPETEELKPQDASKVVSRAVSDILPQESIFKDDEMEEMVEQQIKLSKQTSVTKLHEDENEHKKIQDQNEYHSSFTIDDSAKESQSEPNLNKRCTEGMLPESEAREAIHQVDHSNKVIVQKDDLTEANNNFETIQTPFESPIAVSDLEILAKEDPKTGKIASQDEEMSILQKGPPGETPAPETEEWKPQDASKVVSRTVSGIPQESSFKDDEMEENVEGIPQESSFKDDEMEENIEEQVKLSKQTSVTKLHEDEYEHKKIQDQNEYHSSFTMDNSAKEDQSEPNLNKRPTEGMLPESEVREANQVDHSNKVIAQKDDPIDDLTKADDNFDAIQTLFESSIAVSDLEILAEEDPKTGTDPNIACQDKEMSILQKGPPGETSQPETEELKPQDASKVVSRAVSDILPQESSFQDDEMEEKVEEQVKLSKQTSVTKLHEDENEPKKIQDQNEYHSSLTMDNSAKEDQSEPNLNKRPTEGKLPESEVREAINQVDHSNKVIAQKDDPVDDLTEADNNFEAIQTPFENSIAVSDLEILAEEDPKTGTDPNIACQDKEMSILQKGPPGETSQPETEELKPQEASKVVSRAVSDILPQESSFKDDEMEEKVEEQVNLSKQTSVTKPHEDENEHKKIQDQNEYHSSFTMDDSAKESQSEPNLNKRRKEGMLLESEAREAINQVDHSDKVIVQKDDLTEANNNFETIQTQFESPIAVSDLEILAKEDPKTGKNASLDEEMSILQKGTPGETPEPETEEWKPQDASKVVSRAVSGIPQESIFKDDEMEEYVEEQVKLSKQTNVIKLHEDENEHKKIHQNEYHSSFTMDNSAKEDRSEPNLNKRPTEGMLPQSEVKEAINQVDHSNKVISQKDDPVDDLTEDDNSFEAIQTPFESSIAVSDLEILTEEDPKTGTDPNIASQDEEMPILQKGPPGETPQTETEELKPQDASKVVSRAVSDILPQESSFKDDEMEENVEEQVKHSKQTSVTKLHKDENEHKKIQDQNEYHSSFTMDDSAKQDQSESNLNKRPTEGMLPECEVREAISMGDHPNKVIAQKDDPVNDLTDTNNNFEAIQTPFESSIAVSDLEILAKEDTKTGIDRNIASQDEEMSILQKGPPGETPEQETEELKDQDADNIVSRAVSVIPQESSFKDDEMKEKVEEQVKLSKQNSITKLHKDENEDKKIQDQNESDSSFTMDDSAKEAQDEPRLNKRSTEGMLSESEVRDARDQVDISNLGIAQKDDLTEARNNYEAIHTPFESSIAVSDLEILAKEDPKTGTDTKIASQDIEMSTMQKGPPGETLHSETEELKPEGASKVVSSAVSNISLERSFKDDETEEKFEDQVQLSEQTSTTKLHGNENKEKFHDRDKYHSYFTIDDPAKAVQSEPHLKNKPTEVLLPESEGQEATNQVDHSNNGLAQKDDSVDLTEANNESGAIHTPFESSIAVSDLEILDEEDQKTGTDTKIESQDEDLSIMQKAPIGETLQPEIEELKPEDAFKAVAGAVSDIPQESRFKDAKMEEKLEEQVKLSKQTSVTMKHEDESIDKNIEDQDEYHSSFTMDDSAKEVQNEPHRSKKPTEGMLPESEVRKARNVVDNSNKGIPQKDDLTAANNNSGASHKSFKSSTEAQDLEVTAEEDHKTRTTAELANQDEEMTIMQKDLQPSVEEMKPEDASKAIAKAVRLEHGEEEKCTCNSKVITENFRTTISAESLPLKLEQSKKETPKEPEDGEAHHQEKKITNSALTITRKDRPLNVANKLNANDTLDMQIVGGASKSETEKPIEKADPNFSSIETNDLKEVQQEGIATIVNTVENQEPANYIEDKGNREETGTSTSEVTSMTSVQNLLRISRNENSKVAGDFEIESKQTIQRDEMKDGIAGSLGCDKPNNDEDKNEVEKDRQRNAESAYDNPVIVEASRDADVKVAHKKSHNILSGVGSKVKHSISKVKKVIIGKSSHPKSSSPKK